ncbi:hypothetical protein [Thauera sp. SDU_THAU2]|uniref:hypothetical protein n=1 Tax=Thauera sp. SDU_THAU2 TaxID=3136633 RepID=UPI00311F47F9
MAGPVVRVRNGKLHQAIRVIVARSLAADAPCPQKLGSDFPQNGSGERSHIDGRVRRPRGGV